MKKYLIAIFAVFWAVVAHAGEDHLKVVPADMNIVVGINLEQILEIPLVKQQLATADKTELEKMGLTYEDFKSLTLAFKAGANMDMAAFENMEGIVILEMKKPMEKEKLIASLEKEGKKVATEQLGREIMTVKEGEKDMAFVIDGNSVILGPAESVRNSVRVMNGSAENVTKNATLKKLLLTNNMLYAGGVIKDSAEVNGFSLACNYKDAFDLKAKVYCKTPEIANEALQGVQMMAGMMMQQLQLTEKNIKMSVGGTAFSVEINLPPEKIMQIAMMAMMARGGIGGADVDEGPGSEPIVVEPIEEVK